MLFCFEALLDRASAVAASEQVDVVLHAQQDRGTQVCAGVS